MFPAALPWPVPWQVQDQSPGGGGDPVWERDQLPAAGGGGGYGVEYWAPAAGVR